MGQSSSHTTAAESAAILQLKGVSKSFRKEWYQKPQFALQDLSCHFKQGEITALIGHNGAGKTTTIRIILGLISADRGEVRFAGQGISSQLKSHFGYMPETNKLPLRLNPRECFTWHCKLYPSFKKSKAQLSSYVEEQLHKLGLWEHRHKPIRQLSKGLGRRVAWGLATLHNPDFLILDEPYSGLDPLGRRQMLEWIEQLVQSGKTMLLCTHELSYLPPSCRKIYALKQGKLVYTQEIQAETIQSLYELKIKQVTSLQLQSLQQQKSLVSPLNIQEHPGFCQLLLQRHEEALAWLQSCLERSYLVQSFTPRSLIQEEDLLRFFV